MCHKIRQLKRGKTLNPPPPAWEIKIFCLCSFAVPKLGIRRLGNESVIIMDEDLIEITEGEIETLCVVLLEPEGCTQYIGGTVTLKPNTPSGMIVMRWW
jgi:hypothetical protein